MMLYRKDRRIVIFQPFNRVIEEIDMCDFCNFTNRIGNVVIMVLRRNLYDMVRHIFDRMIAAVLSEF
ncbi:hypothetical protein SDC9_205455 [bioreactor metagenome]|uniref:Uncharacterized protein n=1 Tax=bioreactor metagenome TaxID=1076179 RepID=A0A645J2F1_9ZZZZ